MPTTETKTVSQNPVEAPLYTLRDAARYLHVPLWGMLALTGRFRGWPEPELFFFHFRRGFPGAAITDDDANYTPHHEMLERLTFHRFAELFVRAATFQVLVGASRVEQSNGERWENLYRAIWRGLEDTYRQPVSFADKSIADCVAHLAEPYTGRLTNDQLALLRKWFTFRLERIEVQDGIPVRLYPVSRDPAENTPRTIVIDPRVRFGRPTVASHGIPTDSLYERFQAGDSVTELADDYSLTAAEVEESIRYEAVPPVPLFPFFVW